MIISCPECSGPFELEDTKIAELVQVECPNCGFRMILDFAAANDASLIEDGMKMASGFMSRADYLASVAVPAAEAPVTPLAPVPDEPAPERVPSTSPPATAPQTGAPAAKPTRTKTVVGPFPTPPPSQGPAAEGSNVDDLDYEDEAPTMLHSVVRPEAAPASEEPAAEEPAAEAPAAEAPVEEPAAAQELPVPPRGETVVGPAPTGPVAADAGISSDSRSTVEVDPPVAEVAKADRPPPHTPPHRAASTAGPDSGPVSVPSPREQPSQTDSDRDDELEAPRSSPVATLLVAVLMLAVLGVVAASVVQKQTPDPRPLLEDLLRGM